MGLNGIASKWGDRETKSRLKEAHTRTQLWPKTLTEAYIYTLSSQSIAFKNCSRKKTSKQTARLVSCIHAHTRISCVSIFQSKFVWKIYIRCWSIYFTHTHTMLQSVWIVRVLYTLCTVNSREIIDAELKSNRITYDYMIENKRYKAPSSAASLEHV